MFSIGNLKGNGRMNKLGAVACSLGLLLSFGVTACTGGGADGGSSAKPDGKQQKEEAVKSNVNEPAELVIFGQVGNTEQVWNERFGTALKQKFPNYTFKYIQKNSQNTITNMIASGQTIDLIHDSIGGINADVVNTGYGYDLAELLKKHQLDLNQLEPAVLQSVSVQGKLYGLPLHDGGLVLYYNKDIFDKFGVPYPKNGMTWEQKDKFLRYEDVYNVWVMFAVEAGSFYYEIGGLKGTATFGDIVICPPDTVFRRVVVAPLTFYYLELVWIDSQSSGQQAADIIPAGKISIVNTSRLAHNYAAMRKWHSWPRPVRLPQFNHYCRDIWLLYCDELGEGDMQNEKSAGGKPDPLMTEARLLIEKHAFAMLNLKEIAAALGISAVQLTKKFSSSYGMTPLRYLTSLRLRKAKMLLLETKMTIDQISECCGYQNGFYLHRVFVKYEHTTPSNYRKSQPV
jgi:AraC family transcriptional regulator